MGKKATQADHARVSADNKELIANAMDESDDSKQHERAEKLRQEADNQRANYDERNK